jgi:hypothetical protein
MTDTLALQELLKTVSSLTANGMKRPAGLTGGPTHIADSLSARWSTKQRLIERLLTSGDDVRGNLDLFENRTRDFVARNPDRMSWQDKSGQEWRADLVLQACAEVRDHLESWGAVDEFDDDQDEGDEDDTDFAE